MKVVTTEEMGRIEREADARGLSYATMMENAGRAVAEACQRIGVKDKRIVVLIGPGNNGGDGLVAARHLHDSGAKVTLYIWKRKVKGDENFRLAEERRIPVIWAGDDPGLSRLKALLEESDMIIDALLGTGISRPIGGLLKEILGVAKEVVKAKRRTKALLPVSSPPPTSSSPFVIAVDVPSGLNCDTGAVDPATLQADVTVTFGFPKRGQLLFPGAEYVGKLIVADIGIPPELAEEIQAGAQRVSPLLATPEMVRELLPERPIGAHKGTFGKALVIAGSVNYVGAAYLASAGATRVGAGLVTLALAENIHPILASKLTEVTYLLLPHEMGVLVPDALKILGERIASYDALLIGPGLGREKKTVEFIHRLLGLKPASGKARIGFLAGSEETSERLSLPPFVVDADGLNALSEVPEWWESLPRGNILTPHPGEMSRLTGLSVEEIEADRWRIAKEMAERWGQVVVLKGAFTVIASPEGQVVIEPFANPGLATAGTGDVLAGAIVGFLVQGLEPFAAAICGAYIHGLAGELAREEIGEAGMVAGDLLPRLPKAIALTAA